MTEFLSKEEFLNRYEGDSEDYAHALYVTWHKAAPYTESDIDLAEPFYYGYYCDVQEAGNEWWREIHDGYSADTIEHTLNSMGANPSDFWETLGHTVLDSWEDQGRVIITEATHSLISGVYIFNAWES